MLLDQKVAVIYGAGGSIGGAVARAFAREGARVFLAGRTKAKLDPLAATIRAEGGLADTAIVNALDQRQVDDYVDRVAEQAGAIDISFNLIGLGDVQKPLNEISIEDFLQPITNGMRYQVGSRLASAPIGSPAIAVERLFDEPASSRPKITKMIGAMDEPNVVQPTTPRPEDRRGR